MAVISLSSFERVVKVSSVIEEHIMLELSKLHALTYKNALNNLSKNEVLLKIDLCGALWVKNNHLREILVKPIEEILEEIKARFNARSDLLLGVERYLKRSLKN